MRIPVLAAALVGLLAVPATAKPGLDGAACATGDAARAATSLYGDGTEVVREQRIAGLRTALAMEPYIAPGTRQRMVRAGGRWCDAAAGLNRSRLAGRALVRAYVRLAAAPYFDGVSIRSHRAAAGVHRITTHARTNGVVADWVVVADVVGVRSARWRSERIGAAPLTRELEGLTALPGAGERYVRLPGSTLLEAVRGLPRRATYAPAAELSYTTSDGFTILFSVADTHVGLDPDGETGQERLDSLRMLRDVTGENMEEFLAWGFRSEWAPPQVSVGVTRPGVPFPGAAERTGYVYVNDSTSAYCFACVFIGDDFNIHILSDFDLVLTALGYDYPEAGLREKVSDVVGHEIFHNLQNSYVKPDASDRSVSGYYSEGTARMQETLHDYSKISYQPASLVYANDANGCNGFHGDDPNGSFAGGPFQESYSACNFWLPFYGQYGLTGLVKLVSEGVPAAAEAVRKRQEKTPPTDEAADNQEKILRGLELATGRPYAEAAAAWARGIITGESMTWGPAVGTGGTFDWGKLLERWQPDPLPVGQTLDETLGTGGLMAVEVSEAVRPSAAVVAPEPAAGEPAPPPAPGAPVLAVVRDTAAGSELTFPAQGDYVAGPAPGEKVYVLVVRPHPGEQDVRLSLAPGGTPPATAGPGGKGAASRIGARCRRAKRRVVRCRVTGLTGVRVRAALVRRGRVVARGRARVSGGAATVRLRGKRRIAVKRHTLRLKTGAGTARRGVRVRR